MTVDIYRVDDWPDTERIGRVSGGQIVEDTDDTIEMLTQSMDLNDEEAMLSRWAGPVWAAVLVEE